MNYTIVPILTREPLTLGAEFLALDGAEGEAWKKAIQALHPTLLPQLKESALVEEEESAFCTAGGLFEYQRGQELVLDGQHLALSHCAEHFLDFLLSSEHCLEIMEEKAHSFEKSISAVEQQERFSTLMRWWEKGYSVFVLQHN
ncbi:hypothetical protein [Tumebacillus permanentifrigoris]|uniref:Uncharacterized protein n=1 Tax=Tumebacillus permanentifrigoris TaxID=378543 RepID=A0A316DAQ4_9BACL|nr:hypothetical protein [Tumebacillus permanentifrigoris]PWK13770.1 hypothetical protein C7459_10649 [Tumebacillus permanentifrigoris]